MDEQLPKLTLHAGQVWACGLLLYEGGAGKGSLGEAWAEPSGAVSLCGFLLLLLGTLLYAQVLRSHSGPPVDAACQSLKQPVYCTFPALCWVYLRSLWMRCLHDCLSLSCPCLVVQQSRNL